MESGLHMKMILIRRLCISYPLLKYLLRLLNKLSMQVYRITIHTPHSIVFPKYVV